jgi:hypothetical protein
MVRSSSPPRVKAAVLERPRRSTAGQRLSSLVGKAQEEDETFWSHSIWNEKGGGFADGKRSKKRRRRRQNDDNDDDDKESELSSSSGGGGGSDGEGSTSDNDEESSSDDDGEGSYRMSEDDPSMAEDQFDSDFDESESDDDDNENEMVGEEEFELLVEEKRNAASMKRKKNQRLLSSSLSASAAPPPITGKQTIKKKKGSSKTGKNGASSSKRGPMGTGWNEGLILNWNAQYPLPSSRPLPIVSAGVAEISLPPTSTSSSTTMPAPILSSSSNNLSQLSAFQSMTVPPDATTISQPISDQPPLSSKHLKNGSILQPNQPSQNLRTSSSSAATAITASPSTATSVQPPSPTNKQKHVQLTKKQQLQQSISERKKSQRQQFTQEELILEAVQCTETTNAKWLHARQRNKEEAAVIEKSAAGSKYKHSNTNKKLVSRFYSRRGCHNTLTFMDMDHLPEFLVRGESQHRHPRSPSVCDYAVARKITSPSSRPLAYARNSLEANELTQEQLPRQHQSATSTHSPEQTFEKCIITGKIAKYRDPKSRLGYHDIEAYKELKRKLESGEIVVPKANHVQNAYEAKGRLLSNKIAKGEGERNRASGTTSRKRGDANAIASVVVATTNYFPFADNLPTMIAKITPPTLSLLGTDSVKVMVTQRGVPVSPPLLPSQPPFHSVELPKMSEDDEKQPPEMMQSTKHNGNVECTTIPANIVPTTTSTNEVHATTESEQPMIIPANSYASIVTNDGENGNRHRHDGVIPESNGSGSASVNLPTEGVVAKNNGGGAMERKLIALNSSVPLAPNTSNTKSSSDGAADKVIVPDATASTNDKRTTIEAN